MFAHCLRPAGPWDSDENHAAGRPTSSIGSIKTDAWLMHAEYGGASTVRVALSFNGRRRRNYEIASELHQQVHQSAGSVKAKGRTALSQSLELSVYAA